MQCCTFDFLLIMRRNLTLFSPSKTVGIFTNIQLRGSLKVTIGISCGHELFRETLQCTGEEHRKSVVSPIAIYGVIFYVATPSSR